MAQRPSLILIPTYNEVENIERLLHELTHSVPSADILVIDDNSPDGTGEVVKKYSRIATHIGLLSSPEKQGLGIAYTTGFSWAITHGYSNVIQMDADFSHDPKDVGRLITELNRNDVVIGSRYIPGGSVSGWPLYRRLLSLCANWYARTYLGLPVKDLTSGFIAWKCSALRTIFCGVTSRGYVYLVELKLRAYGKNLRLMEIPIHFENRRLGKSKISEGIIWEGLLQVLKLRLKHKETFQQTSVEIPTVSETEKEKVTPSMGGTSH